MNYTRFSLAGKANKADVIDPATRRSGYRMILTLSKQFTIGRPLPERDGRGYRARLRQKHGEVNANDRFPNPAGPERPDPDFSCLHFRRGRRPAGIAA